MKTKGALVWDFHQPWSVEEIEIGDPRKGEVKVALEVAGMCHSDHHIVTGDIPVAAFPVLGGHEGAGIVVEVGEGVDGLAPGDHVAASFIPSCGTCRACQSGQRNLCDLGMGLMSGTSVSDGTFRVQAREQNVYPYSLLGTFSPYLVVHRTSVVKIDPAIPFEAAALVSCGVTTGWGSATRQLRGASRIRRRARRVEARARTQIRCHPGIFGSRSGARRDRRADLGSDGPQGHRHRRQDQRL